MSYYRAGLGAMMFDGQLRRIEGLESKAIADLNLLVTKADKTAGRVSTALLASALVTGLSTILIMREARKTRRP